MPDIEWPAGTAYLVEAFTDLSCERSFVDGRPSAIGFEVIEAWCRLTHTPLEPWQVRCIAAMDAAYRAALAEELTADQRRHAKKG